MYFYLFLHPFLHAWQQYYVSKRQPPWLNQKLQKKSSTGTPRCLKQVRSAPCGRIELGHVKQVNPSTKRHIKTSEKTIQDSQRPEKPDLE
jgi:hypothetical protein